VLVCASFNPVNALNPGLVYTATITTGAKSSAGIPLASNYVWNFTTSNVVVTPPVITSGLFFWSFGKMQEQIRIINSS
jgi:hypothetical protein